MLTSLKLKNWQCHKNLNIKFDKITCLIGDNGSGKSAIVRALKFICLNKWDGMSNDHITWGADESEIEIRIDKHTIKRVKGKSNNTYTLDEEEFKSFQSGIPDPISNLLKITNRNFQSQDDMSFWLHLTGGELVKNLNDIVNLEEIDEIVNNIAKISKDCKSKISLGQERLDNAQIIKKSLDWLKEASEQLSTIESLEREIEERDSRIEQAERELARLSQVTEEYQRAQTKLLALKSSADLLAGISIARSAIADLERTIALEENYCQTIIKLKKKKASFLSTLKICPLCGRTDLK